MSRQVDLPQMSILNDRHKIWMWIFGCVACRKKGYEYLACVWRCLWPQQNYQP